MSNTQSQSQRNTAILRKNIKNDMPHLEDWQLMFFTWSDKGAVYSGKLMDMATQCGVSAFAGACAIAKTWHQISSERRQRHVVPVRWR